MLFDYELYLLPYEIICLFFFHHVFIKHVNIVFSTFKLFFQVLKSFLLHIEMSSRSLKFIFQVLPKCNS